MSRDAYVYLMSNVRTSVPYIGVTNDLVRRVAEHQLGLQPGFTQRYRCTKLVYFESGDSIVAAIQREKQLKELAPAMEGGTGRIGQSLLGRPRA